MSDPWSFAQAREIASRAPMRDLETPCRCGWVDDKPLGTPPVRVPIVTLRYEDGPMRLETSPRQRTCAACTHPILAGCASVVHRYYEGGGVYNRYHPECVDAGKELT